MTPATQLAVLTVLTRLLKDQHTQVKQDTVEMMDPGDRKTALLGDHKIASVSMTDPSPKATVVDEAAFLRWVQDNHPTEVVSTVRDSYRAELLSQCRANGAAADANGQPIPGVKITRPEPYPTVRLAPGAVETIAQAWQTGALPELGALLAIDRGADADAG